MTIPFIKDNILRVHYGSIQNWEPIVFKTIYSKIKIKT